MCRKPEGLTDELATWAVASLAAYPSIGAEGGLWMLALLSMLTLFRWFCHP
jgi:hypothetical protein